MATNRISVLVALEGSDDGLKRALNSAPQSLGDLAANAKPAGEKAAAGLAVLGRPIVVNNRGGASGTIGVAALVHSVPDGNTCDLSPRFRSRCNRT